jgi:hypothetical protein
MRQDGIEFSQTVHHIDLKDEIQAFQNQRSGSTTMLSALPQKKG